MKTLSQKNRVIIFAVIEALLLTGTVLIRVFYGNAPKYIWWMLTFIVLIYTDIAVVLSRKDLEISFLGTSTVYAFKKVVQSKKFTEMGGMFGLGLKQSAAPSRFRIPKGYTFEKIDVDGVPVERLTFENSPIKDKVIFQIHGGGFSIPMTDMYRRSACRYSKISGGATVINVDYRVGPKFKHPAALEDVEKVWNWLLKEGYKPENIIIAGDSAGGNLTLALTLKLRDENKQLPNSLICMSPWGDLAGSGKSYVDNAFIDPMFGARKGQSYEDCYNEQSKIRDPYADQVADLTDSYISPVYGDYKGFPPMLIQSGTAEILLSDSETVTQKARDAGVSVIFTKYKGMFHVFQMLCSFCSEGKLAWYEVEMFLKFHINNN